MHRLTQPLASLVLAAASLAAPHGAAAADAQMRERVAACAACHGEAGRSDAERYYPSIAGKPAGYLYQQLLNFRDGRREHAVMERMFAYLSDDYLRAIADYYAAQAPAIAAPQTRAAEAQLQAGRALVERGDPARELPACTACHGERLTGVAPAIPGLVGLPADYLSAQLGAWRVGTRKARAPDCMHTIARALDETEIAAVTAWIASLPTSADHRPASAPPAPLPMDCGELR